MSVVPGGGLVASALQCCERLDGFGLPQPPERPPSVGQRERERAHNGPGRQRDERLYAHVGHGLSGWGIQRPSKQKWRCEVTTLENSSESSFTPSRSGASAV